MFFENMSLAEQVLYGLKNTKGRKKFKIILKSFIETRQKALATFHIGEKISLSSIQSSLKLSDNTFLILKSLSDTKSLLMLYDNVVLCKQELTDEELLQIYKNI